MLRARSACGPWSGRLEKIVSVSPGDLATAALVAAAAGEASAAAKARQTAASTGLAGRDSFKGDGGGGEPRF